MPSPSLESRIRTLRTREITKSLDVLNRQSLAWKNQLVQDTTATALFPAITFKTRRPCVPAGIQIRSSVDLNYGLVKNRIALYDPVSCKRPRPPNRGVHAWA
jgi:hypothetical protein